MKCFTDLKSSVWFTLGSGGLSQHRHVCVSKTLGKKVFIYGLYKECFNLEESMVALHIGLTITFSSQRPL